MIQLLLLYSKMAYFHADLFRYAKRIFLIVLKQLQI